MTTKTKICILTSFDNNDNTNYYNYTLPSIIKYSQKCDSDFLEGNNIPIPDTLKQINIGNNSNIIIQKLVCIRNALEIYDRVLWVEPHCFINEDCPNIFDIVPNTYMGNVSDYLTNLIGLPNACSKYLQSLGMDISNKDIISNHIMLFSKKHIDMFCDNEILKHNKFNTQFGEQIYLNEMIHRYNFPKFILDEKFNRCCITTKNIMNVSRDNFIKDLHKMRNGNGCADYNNIIFTKDIFNENYHSHAFIYAISTIYNDNERETLLKNLVLTSPKLLEFIKTLDK